MNKKLISKKTLKYLFIISGFIPAHYLLLWAVVFLFGFVSGFKNGNIPKDFQETISFLGLIIGCFGYIGLLLSLIPKFENKYILKIIFLVLGVSGFVIFFSSAGDGGFKFGEFLKSYFHFAKFDSQWFFLCMLPNYVSLGLIIYFCYKLYKIKKIQ